MQNICVQINKFVDIERICDLMHNYNDILVLAMVNYCAMEENLDVIIDIYHRFGVICVLKYYFSTFHALCVHFTL